MLKNYIVLYVIFCLVGAGVEWCYGAFWDVVGVTPWLYPESPLLYTSLDWMPLWGFAAFVILPIHRAVTERNPKLLKGIVVPLALAMLWIAIYSWFIA